MTANDKYHLMSLKKFFIFIVAMSGPCLNNDNVGACYINLTQSSNNLCAHRAARGMQFVTGNLAI